MKGHKPRFGHGLKKLAVLGSAHCDALEHGFVIPVGSPERVMDPDSVVKTNLLRRCSHYRISAGHLAEQHYTTELMVCPYFTLPILLTLVASRCEHLQ